MKKILCSLCLYGEKIVRYDGKDKHETHPIFQNWKDEGRLIPVCPEVFGGLLTPRPPAERRGDRIINSLGVDVSAQYTKGAEEALRIAKENDIAFAIMKQSSPSCGSKKIYDGTFTHTKVEGMGLTVELLNNAGFKVFSEEEIEEADRYLKSLE